MIRQTWTGPSGRVWDLTSREGVFFREGALRGLGMPEFENYRRPLGLSHGSRWDGWRVTGRDVEWPLHVEAPNALAWVDADRALWQDFTPGSEGVWSVYTPDGARRTLRCRVSGDQDHAFELDPSRRQSQDYALRLDGDAFWIGDVVTRSWSQDGYAGPWLLGSGTGGVMRFATGQTMGGATVTNPGDVEAWVEWTITGPATLWSVGVAGATVSSSQTLLAGETRRLLTDPSAQVLLNGAGADRTSELGAVSWSAVKAGASVPLSVSMTGTGSISASFRPRYLRAL